MAEDTDTVAVMPGIDSPEHPQELHERIAAHLSAVRGRAVAPSEVVPPIAQQPLTGADDISTDTSLKQQFLGETVGEEPARGYFSLFMGRLRKKNPGREIKEK